jgi:hypothetical protein
LAVICALKGLARLKADGVAGVLNSVLISD